MKRAICIASITLVAMSHSVDANAQNAGSEVAEAPHRLVEGAWALQFGVSGTSLSPFGGSTISAKHHFSAGRALRYGLGVRASYHDREDVDPDHNFDVHLHLDIHLSTLYVAYPTLSDDHGANIHLFYGVGPLVGFSRREVGSLDETQFTVGVAGAIGAEWFVKTRISLSAEYLTSAEFGWGDRVNSLLLNPAGGRMGVSIYF